MEKIFNDIKTAYENKVLRDYFTIEYVSAKGTYKIVFMNDWGRWRFSVSKGLAYPYVYSSDWISDGIKLTDSNILEVVETIKSLSI